MSSLDHPHPLQTEKGLTLEESVFRMLMESPSDLLSLHDCEGTFLYVSPAVGRLGGYVATEVVGKNIREFLHPDDWNEIQRLKQLEEMEFPVFPLRGWRWLQKDGSYLWLETSTRVTSREPLRILALSRPISEQRLETRRLFRAEIELRAAFESSLDSIFYMKAERDGSGRIQDFVVTRVNPKGCAMMRKTAWELIGRKATELYPVITSDGTFQKFVEVTESRVALEEEMVMENTTGRGLDAVWLWRQIVHIPDGIVLSIRDISERKRLEQEKEEIRTRFLQIFDESTVGMTIIDSQSRFIKVNDFFCRMVGYSQEELLQMSVTDLTYPEDQHIDSETSERLRAGSTAPYRIEKRYVRKDGEIIWVTISAHFHRHPISGEAYGMGMVHDVTHAKKRELQFLATSKMAALGEMSAGLAHEINNPLFVISGRAQQIDALIEEGGLDVPTLKQKVDKITEMTDRIARIVRGLRTFAREASGDPFELKPLRSIIDETIELCHARFKNQSIEIRMGDIPPSFEVECRPVQISQVLLNLMNNSFDAVSGDDERWVQFDCEDLGDRMALSITDSGGGITEEVAMRIMQPFFTTKEPGRGTGLGLSISSGIVQSHRGQLYLDREAPNTRFVIELPKRQHG